LATATTGAATCPKPGQEEWGREAERSRSGRPARRRGGLYWQGMGQVETERDTEGAERRLVRRVRRWLVVMMVGLVLSGLTAFALERELRWLLGALRWAPVWPIAQSTGLSAWIERVSEGVADANARYPFLAYGTDWLAFAHLAIAALFIGPFLGPVRNKWVISFGLIACAGAIPLLMCRRSIAAIERQRQYGPV